MWDILYMVDASSSMADVHTSRTGKSFVKGDSVKESLVNLLAAGTYPFGSRLGVSTFQAPTTAGGLFLSGDKEMIKTILPMTNTDEVTPASLRTRLASIKVGGATPAGIAIEEGLRQLYESDEGPVRRIKKMVMVTDEKSNVGPRPERVVSDEVASKAIIDIIAIGGKVNRETLESVAKKTGGRFSVVEGADELLEALKPRIEMRGLGDDVALLAGAAKASKDLEVERLHGTTTLEYRAALEKARQARAKLNKRLIEVLMLKNQAEVEVKTLASQVQKGLSMKEYAVRVWPRAAELEQVAKVEKELRGAMERLAA